MIKRISLLIFCFLLVPTLCLADFTISLKNGGRIITKYYWQEGDQIKCYYADGVLGISRDQVVDIQKSSVAGPVRSSVTILTREEKGPVAQEEPAPEEEAKAEEEKGAEQEQQKQEEAAPKRELSPEDVEHYKKQKDRLTEERRDAQEKLEAAIAAGDRNTKKAMMKKLQRLTEEEGEFSKEIKAKTDGAFPEWWLPPRE